MLRGRGPRGMPRPGVVPPVRTTRPRGPVRLLLRAVAGYNPSMTINVPDDILRQAGLTERDALVEFACRLFDAERLDLFAGARLAGLSRADFEAELRARRIPIYRPTLQDVDDDEAALGKLGA